jgi:hypothetical protein
MREREPAMTDHPVRLFASEEAIRLVGEAMLACTLPRADWTHEGHLAACAWLILERPDILQLSIRGARAALARSEGRGLVGRVNLLLESPEGRRDWPLRFYSPALLFSKEARLGWVEPDLATLPPLPTPGD